MAETYLVTINGVDRIKCIYNKSVVITDDAGDAPSLMTVDFYNRDGGSVPVCEQEIIVTRNGTKLFAGYITEIAYTKLGGSIVKLRLECIDYTRILSRKLVVEGYEDMTDKAIIEDIVSKYCQGTGITTTNVVEGITINQITFNYMSPAQCLSQICALTGRNWYLDYDKDIHYFALTTSPAPFNIDSDNNEYYDLEINKNNSNIKNRVYVRGGKYESDEVNFSQVADGEQVVFLIPDELVEYSWTLKVNTVEKSLGIKNIDKADMWDYLVNIREKYFECALAGTPVAGTVMSLDYKYYIPVLVAVSDKESIEEIGVYEYAIFDSNITNVQQARDRAQAELTDYANTLVDGRFYTKTNGFVAGQYININLSEMAVNANYLVQKVVARSLGGGEFEYAITIASAKKIGILNFLIGLLEKDKDALNIDKYEVVDELLEIDTEEIEIDDDPAVNITLTSKAPPYQWGSFKWGLAEWSGV